MRLSFASHFISFDVWLGETPEDEDRGQRMVAGQMAADLTLTDQPDALQQMDESPEDKRRRGIHAPMGFAT